MRGDTSTATDRGQAYTLEGFIGAMVVLMAVLFALQSVVITPTTGGLADRTVQQQIQQETQDALVVANQDDGNLSETIRRWDQDGGFENANDPAAPGEDNETYSVDDFANESRLGSILEQRFAENGWSYNVELHTAAGENKTLVYQGSPPSDAVTASYTVSLYDNHTTTGSSTEELHETREDERTIPREYDDSRRLYNVVEVRVIVW